MAHKNVNQPVLDKKNLKFSVDPRLEAKELRMNPVLQKKVDDSGWGLPGLRSLPVSAF